MKTQIKSTMFIACAMGMMGIMPQAAFENIALRTVAESEKTYIEGDLANTKSGLVLEHIQKFKDVAKKNNMYILFRPVNPLATNLIKNGAATKERNVHGKSSDWGPMAGYIPYDQDLSKKHGNLKAVSKGNLDNQHSLNEFTIKKCTLVINDTRLQELVNRNVVNIEQKNLNKEYIFLKVSNDTYEFRINKISREVQYKTKEGRTTILGETFNWKTIEVIAKGDKDNLKPLTADYDLFALSPHIETITNWIPEKELKNASRKENSEKWKELTKLLITHGLERKENSGKGDMPSWQENIIQELNNAAKESGYTGGTVVNHATEQDNENVPEQDNEIFIITPTGQTILTMNWNNTQEFIKKNITEQDYLFYRNRTYNVISGNGTIQIPWNERIPTNLEFHSELEQVIRIVTKNDKNNLSVFLNNYPNVASDIIEIEKNLQNIYKLQGSNDSILNTKQNYMKTLFQQVQELLKKDFPHEAYKNYFTMLKERILWHIDNIQ